VSTDIYYFSGTGNSLHAAKELQSRLPECRLIPILGFEDDQAVAATADVVGFVFPHYASTLPRVVRSFIEKLELAAASYLFAVATRGGTRTMAFAELDGLLEPIGRRLDAQFVFTMPSGSAPLVKDFATQMAAERTDRLESAMLAGLDTIRDTVLNRRTSRAEDVGATPPPRFLVPLMPLIRAASPLLISLGKRVESSFDFYYDDTCTGCGICEDVCLAGKVRVANGGPEWQEGEKCHGCFACLNYCPEEAIQVESKWYLKSYTEQNGRYHHPAISARDIAAQKQGAANPSRR
jgi:NAD-dependent dihydropyrimidine dehydrogenase PreA subunit